MDAAERAAWLRLTQIEGLGPAGVCALLARFGLPQTVLQASCATLETVVDAKVARALAAPPAVEHERALTAVERWLERDERHRLLTLADTDYPQDLLAIHDPPPVLYAAGRVELLNRPALAIVGSRNATRQGVEIAESFAHTLAQGGLTIVSGMALGIDAAAHRGALRAADLGSTVAVVGTGADLIYPSSNRPLAEAIRGEGVLISEFPLGTPAVAHNFPRRNRLIAGLARGVLVVEAAVQSGSLITARLAGELGREVFAIPGSIHAPLARGCHRLIRQGARLVESANDVLEELALPLTAVAGSPAGRATPPHADVLEQLGHAPVALDTLAMRCKRPAGELAAALLELELAQYVERLPGGRYQRLG